jgi:hypothetical protein
MTEPSQDAALNLKNLSLGQKILIGILVLAGLAFVGYMNFAQKSGDQEQMKAYYQDYTQQATATVSKVEKNSHAKGRTSFLTTVTFTTQDGQEITASLLNGDFVAEEGSMVAILYNPTTPDQVVTVETYTSETGLTP